MTKIECEWCGHPWDVDEGDVTDEDGDMDGFSCPECGSTTYYRRRLWG